MMRDPDSEHDFGKNVIPQLLTQGATIYAYDFSTNHIPGDSVDALPYWKDVGTVDSFYEANMDLKKCTTALQPLQPSLADSFVAAKLSTCEICSGREKQSGRGRGLAHL